MIEKENKIYAFDEFNLEKIDKYSYTILKKGEDPREIGIGCQDVETYQKFNDELFLIKFKNWEPISVEDISPKNNIEKILNTWYYVFNRRGFDIRMYETSYRFEGTIESLPSQWASNTNMALKFREVDDKELVVSVAVTGTSVLERAYSWGLQDLVVRHPEREGMLLLEAEGVTSKKFFERIVQHSFEQLEVLSILQKLNIQEFQEIKIETQEFNIEQKPHSCEACGTERPGQCWYEDNDGILTFKEDNETFHYHITCDRVIQLTTV